MESQRSTIVDTYRIRLLRGEEVLQTLTTFCIEKHIVHASLHAIGAVERARVGYYDVKKRAYSSQVHADVHEVVSMTGNVALVDEKPFLHVHVVLSDTHNHAYGGHLFEAIVAVTFEVELVVYKEPLVRVHDDTMGLKLLSCSM